MSCNVTGDSDVIGLDMDYPEGSKLSKNKIIVSLLRGAYRLSV
jgi:hypothetical protein